MANLRKKSREEGIRTPDTLPYTRFPSVRLKPLGHLSVLKLRTAKISFFYRTLPSEVK